MRKNIIILISATFVLMVITSCTQIDNNKKMESEKSDKMFEKALNEIRKDPFVSLNNDSVKKQFANKYLELRVIINRHDPIGLLKYGAPEDEYDPEVKTIIVQLNDKQTKEQIHNLVYSEFLRWFNDESTTGPKSAYNSLATDIYNWNKKENK